MGAEGRSVVLKKQLIVIIISKLLMNNTAESHLWVVWLEHPYLLVIHPRARGLRLIDGTHSAA
jgi:hypothetical protein